MIGIITVLASLLLPTLGRAKSAARAAKCKSNLRQLGLAMRLYVDDFQAFALAGGLGYNDWSETLAQGYLTPSSVGTLRTVKITVPTVFLCPSRMMGRRSDADVSISYGYNGIGFAQKGLGGNWVGSLAVPLIIPVRENEVLSPTSMLMLGDGVMRFQGGSLTLAAELERCVSDDAARDFRSDLPRLTKAAYRQHDGSFNVANTDGHVESIPIPQLLFDDGAAALSRWNRDEKPHLEALAAF